MTSEQRYLSAMQRIAELEQRINVDMGQHTLGFVAIVVAITVCLYLLGCLLLKCRPKFAVLGIILLIGLLAAFAICIRYF